MLSLTGGSLGVGLSYAAAAYIRQLPGLSIPLLKNVEIDGAVLGVALGVTLFTAVLFGLAPAVAAVKGDLGPALKDSGRGSSEGRDHRVLRSGLVVSEVALACVLLIGAGLLMRSFLQVLDVDLGFQPEQTYALRIDASNDDELGNIDTQEKFTAYIRRITAAAESVPGVEASVTDAVPLESNRTWGVRRKDQRGEETIGALVKLIGPDLMATMRTPVISGREFAETDDHTREPVALVNRGLAELLWPGEDPIGKPLMNGNREFRVIGVVADVRHLSVEESAGPEFYLALLQQGSMSPSLVVRTSRPFGDVGPALRGALRSVVSDLPTSSFTPLDQVVDRALSGRRFFVNLLIAFAAAALLLAAIGIYGVIAYSVTRRTAEIGIRMALGATAAGVRASVVNDTLRLTLIGVAIGLAGAAALSSLITSLLYDVSPSDPWTFTAAAGVLLLVAAAAGFIPAARASRISPISALRAD